jgi:hypothetical protein
MVEFLCEVGGRYRNKDGTPSGIAYDLSSYVGAVWDALVEMGEDPLLVATDNWSKARVLIPTVKANVLLLNGEGKEVKAFDQAVTTKIVDEEPIRNVLRLIEDNEVSANDMRYTLHQKRTPPFIVMVSLQKNGDWNIHAHLTDTQFELFNRLIQRHADVMMEG